MRKELLALWNGAQDQKYGETLFNAAFPQGSELLRGYREALALARHQDKRLRFRLRVNAEPLLDHHSLNWELLRDPLDRIALSRAREIAFSRYANIGLPPLEPIAAKPRILVVISNPGNIETECNLPALDRTQVLTRLKRSRHCILR
jgi:hypothetical protein